MVHMRFRIIFSLLSFRFACSVSGDFKWAVQGNLPGPFGSFFKGRKNQHHTLATGPLNQDNDEEIVHLDTMFHDKDLDPYIPINSEGDHTGMKKVRDVILLFVFLLVPFAIYGCIRLYEYIQRQREAKAKQPTPESDASLPDRVGSCYNMVVPGQKKLDLTPLKHGKTDLDVEGTHSQNILAGFSTAMAALPDAISFSFITGVSPLNGIWAGCIMGISAALVGGRPGMISSASAATAVVLAEISTDPRYGMGPMALCVFIVGILQLIAGYFRLSRFITLIPHPVMLGFVNGLAIVMIRAQLRQYHLHGDGPWVEGKYVLSMTITALFAMFVAVVWARLNKFLPSRLAKVMQWLPAPLASVVLTTVFSIVVNGILPKRTLRDVAGSRTFRGGFATMPSWDFPPAGVDWHSGHMWGKVISIAVRFAIVGLLESLMTQALIDQITGTTGSARRECFGQGVGNIISSFFGTQGGCALIAQSLMNVGSGGLSRVSGLVMGISLGICVVVLAPVMAIVPVAALVGLIALIALNTFAWSSLELILRINWIDAIVVVVVTVVTVWHDLAVAVILGLIINALGFAWTAATQVQINSYVEDDTRLFCLSGPLFFGSAMNYQKEINPQNFEEKKIILDFTKGSILDISATDAIVKVHESLKAAGRKVTLKGVPPEALKDMKTVPPEDVDKGLHI